MEKLVPIEAPISLDNYSFDYLYLRESIDYIRKHDPRFRGASIAILAAHAGIAESTFKKLLAGSIEDPRSSTLWLLCHAFDLDPRRLMRLPVPAGDIRPGATSAMEEDLRLQLNAAKEQLRLDSIEMSELRRIALAAEKAQAHAEERRDALIDRVEELKADALRHRAELRRHRWALLGVVLLTLCIFSYVAWEIANPTKGLIQLHYDNMNK